jgi:hypothetical protein
MGIMHFAGLGKSAGAVTAGLSCIKARYGQRHTQYGDAAENLIIFTSPEIADGTEPAFPAEHNEYLTITARKTWPRDETNTLKIVTGFAKQEFPDTALYVITEDVNDFSACFDAVGRAALKFHEPGQVGKHIWANITGGSNLLNAAMVQIAYLSGVIGRLYYTFVADLRQHGRYLQAFSKDERLFRYREIYTLKTRFGWRHQKVLEVLEQTDTETTGRYVGSQGLLSRLKGFAPEDFQDMDLPTFRRDFLNVMQGIEQLGDRESGQQDAVRLSEDGREILSLVRRPLFRALVQREQLSEHKVEAIISGLNIRRLN